MYFIVLVDPEVLFFVESPITGTEDSDVLIPCPVTDPDVSNFTLRKCNGKPLPETMVLVPDLQKGITVKNLERPFHSCYQCVAWQNGVPKMSEIMRLFVRPGKASLHVDSYLVKSFSRLVVASSVIVTLLLCTDFLPT